MTGFVSDNDWLILLLRASEIRVYRGNYFYQFSLDVETKPSVPRCGGATSNSTNRNHCCTLRSATFSFNEFPDWTWPFLTILVYFVKSEKGKISRNKITRDYIVFFFLESQIQTEPTAQSVVLVSVATSWFSCTYIPEINFLVGSTKGKERWLSYIYIDLFGSQWKTLFTFLSAIELNWK